MAIERRNRISEQYSARSIEMLESPAYRVLSLPGHRVVSRIEIELAHHGGNDNGRLPVTHQNFIDNGMHKDAVAPAIREAEALGFIRVTERGRGGNAERRQPNKFVLTFAYGPDSLRNPPTHDGARSRGWRKPKPLRVRRATIRTRVLLPMAIGAREKQKTAPGFRG